MIIVGYWNTNGGQWVIRRYECLNWMNKIVRHCSPAAGDPKISIFERGRGGKLLTSSGYGGFKSLYGGVWGEIDRTES